MILAAFALAAALAGPAPAAAAWQTEPGMIGVLDDGVIPPDGVLLVNGWRYDGGIYVDDDTHTMVFYSTDSRIGLALEKFVARDAGGNASWTIANFMSVPAVRERAYVNTDCGLGADFAGRSENAVYVVAVVDGQTVPADKEVYTGVLAAAQVDLKAGAIVPISPANVYCLQTIGD